MISKSLFEITICELPADLKRPGLLDVNIFRKILGINRKQHSPQAHMIGKEVRGGTLLR